MISKDINSTYPPIAALTKYTEIHRMNPIALPRGSTSTHQATALLSQTSYHLEWAAYYTSDNHKLSVIVIVICSASNSAYIPSGAISGFKKNPNRYSI